MSVLLISPESGSNTPIGEMIDILVDEMISSGMSVRTESSSRGMKEGLFAVSTDADVIVVDWNVEEPCDLIRNIRSLDSEIKIFLMTDPRTLPDIPIEVISMVNEYIWIMGDTPSFIAGRIEAAGKKYRKDLLPPMFKSLVEFSEDFEYSWHTPGHTAGTAFLKSPIGRLFFYFF